MGKLDQTITLHDATLPASDGFGRVLSENSRIPANIGRFIVRGQLGEGGMGSVLEAYDEALERPVAIKVLHQDPLPGHESRHSLRREAQVLARLSHPNVVHVYEVGEHQGQVYLAMELIRGGTLTAWARARSRTFEEIRDVMCKAGRGLRAAHAEGLVHRDFKPDNVLVGPQGRPRVVDFGLARAMEVQETVAAARVEVDPEEPTPAVQSRIAGTVPYMAPEQLLGLAVDARTDQFAFCVAFYELVYGQHPFGGDDALELSLRIADGDVERPPGRRGVPPGLAAVLLRGLERRPEHRHSDMAALLEALEHVGRTPRHPSKILVGAAAGLMSLGVVSSVAGAGDAQPCGSGRALVEQLWDGPQRDQLHDAIVGSGFDYAGTTWVRLRDHLDAYATGWVDAHQEACRAETLASDDAEASLERRMECLGDRLREFDGLLEVLSAPDETTVEHAVAAATSLPAVADCANPSMLPVIDEDPTPPEDRAAVAHIRERLAAARALLGTGNPSDADAELSAVEDRVEALDLPSLRVEAMLLRGQIALDRGQLPRAEQLLADAFWIAEGRGLEPLAVDAGVLLVNLVGDRLQRFDEGLGWYRHTRSVVERAGIDGVPRAWLLNNRGNILFKQARYAAAADAYRTALSIAEQHDAPLAEAAFANNSGNVHLSLGRLPQAQEQYRRALQLRERELGPTHPDLLSSLTNLGTTYLSDGDAARALPLLERARTIAEGPGRDPIRLGNVLTNLGLTLDELGERDRARANLDRARGLFEDALGPEHPSLATIHQSLGDLAAAEGHWEQSEQSSRRAIAIFEAAVGSEHPNLAIMHESLGLALRALERAEEAREAFGEVLRIREVVFGDEDESLLLPLVELGELELDARSMGAAREHLRRAQGIAATQEVSGELRQRLDAALARLPRLVEG